MPQGLECRYKFNKYRNEPSTQTFTDELFTDFKAMPSIDIKNDELYPWAWELCQSLKTVFQWFSMLVTSG